MIYIETKQQTETRLSIIETIEDTIGVPRELWEIKRSKSITEVMIRDIYINLLYNTKMFTLERIAKMVGLKNHCTVLQSLERSNGWSESEQHTIENKMLDQVRKAYEQRNN